MFDRALIGVYLRGIAMGAADVVPGVSGGTVAFITGIYERLLNSIKSINPNSLLLWKREGFRACWQHIDGSFLLVLFLGILSSIAVLARAISFMLEAYPLLLWSFFFGLIVASALHIAKQIEGWNMAKVGALLLGVVIAYSIAIIKPAEIPATPLFVFLAGSIAICAMILPGISGSFLLVLMGLYSQILTAVKEFNILILGCFLLGCGAGLLTFTHLLSWLLKRFHQQTMSVLTGFLLGSLYLVWPWKQTLSVYLSSKGIERPLEQQNVLPETYTQVTGLPSDVLWCLLLAVAGVVLVWVLELFGGKKSEIK